ncbi:MAG TPA: UpxY family transcription antiterminator [Bryobacteraceae bacterium]|nr:UpxY family transcription antiterminator [Bryobacteraceae bacterium]
MSEQWYAVHTRSNFDKRVANDLAMARIESYCPTIERPSTRKDRRLDIQSPLFPGYVFARFSDGPQVRRRIVCSPGVVRILGFNGELEPIPDEEIEAVRRLLTSTHGCSAHPLIREGARVRVCRGALRGIEGVLTKVRNSLRIAVNIELLSQSVIAEVYATDVEPLPMPWRRV